MLDLTEKFWFWTFRYVDNRELAILAATCDERFTDTRATICLMDLIKGQKHNLIDTSRGCYPTDTSLAEWGTWVAFELCPLIEIYAGAPRTIGDKPNMIWRRMKP